MTDRDRRRYRRAALRLPISRMQGIRPDGPLSDLWTTDVSAGGMLFEAPVGRAPGIGTPVRFEITVPPGEGHSVSPGRVRGSGRVVRTTDADAGGVGIAVEFTRPLALEF